MEIIALAIRTKTQRDTHSHKHTHRQTLAAVTVQTPGEKPPPCSDLLCLMESRSSRRSSSRVSPEAASGSGRPTPMTHRCADELSSHRFPPTPSGGAGCGAGLCSPADPHTQQLGPSPCPSPPPFLSLTAGLGLKLEPWHRAMRRADSSHSLTALEV